MPGIDYRVRKRGGKVDGVATILGTFAGSIDPRFHELVHDPDIAVDADPPILTSTKSPDGIDHVRGNGKMWDGTVIRNPTAAEVAAQAEDFSADKRLAIRDGAIPRLRDPVNQGIIAYFVGELNVLRDLHGLPRLSKEIAILAIEGSIRRGDHD